MEKLHGYDSEGARTLGAEYAREHLEDFPDEARKQFGTKVDCGGYKLTIGEQYRILGLQLTLLAAHPVQGMVLDARRYGAATLEHAFPVGRLLLWRGYYWRVVAVKGVNVALRYHGTKPRQPGWVTYSQRGIQFARPVKA